MVTQTRSQLRLCQIAWSPYLGLNRLLSNFSRFEQLSILTTLSNFLLSVQLLDNFVLMYPMGILQINAW